MFAGCNAKKCFEKTGKLQQRRLIYFFSTNASKSELRLPSKSLYSTRLVWSLITRRSLIITEMSATKSACTNPLAFSALPPVQSSKASSTRSKPWQTTAIRSLSLYAKNPIDRAVWMRKMEWSNSCFAAWAPKKLIQLRWAFNNCRFSSKEAKNGKLQKIYPIPSTNS